MPPRPRFSADYGGIGEMIRAPLMEAEMRRRATLIKERARSIAPMDTGQFKDRFHVDSGRRGGLKNDRAWASVTNSDPAAVSIEFGTSKTAAHHTLTTAIQAARD